MSHGPIEKKHRDTMNAIGEVLDTALTGHGFCLLVFDKNVSEGRMNYISNAERSDMIVAMKEFIANHEGRVPPVSAAVQ